MSNPEILSAIIFIGVASITPGPNNIACASMGLVFGYGKTLPFISGILTGFFGIMLFCGSMSAAVLNILPSLSSWVRWAGCLYILWLAWLTYKASYSFEEGKEVARLGFGRGILLQFLNPKLLFYGITLYSAFLSSITTRPALLLTWTAGLTVAAFFTLSIWTFFGTALKLYITSPRLKKYINIFLSLLLVYTAISLLLMKG